MEIENIHELINNIRKRTKIGKPLGDSKLFKKMEKLSGKKFTFRKNGRPKKENKWKLIQKYLDILEKNYKKGNAIGVIT